MSTSEGKSKAGRPVAINEEKLEIFRKIVEEYEYITDEEIFFMFNLECEENKLKPISYTTFKEYKSNPQVYKNNKDYELIKKFSSLIKKAQVKQKNQLISDIKKGDSGWQAKAWITERKFSDNWSNVNKVKQENVSYNIDTTHEEYKKINKALEDEY